jgi:hypothetical protein
VCSLIFSIYLFLYMYHTSGQNIQILAILVLQNFSDLGYN